MSEQPKTEAAAPPASAASPEPPKAAATPAAPAPTTAAAPSPAPKPEGSKPEASKAEAPKPAAAPSPAPAPAAPAAAKPAPPPKPAPVAAAPSPVMPPPAVLPGQTPGLPKAARPEVDSPTMVKLEISTKTLALIVTGLTILICFFCGTTLFLLVRLADRHPVVLHQPPGLDKPGVGAPPKVPGGAAVAAAPDAHAPGAKPEDASAPPAAAADPAAPVKIGETFAKFGGAASTSLLGTWPTFRGPRFDNVMSEPVKLADKWPSNGPPVLWSLDLGEGHSGAAVHKGKVYILDYDFGTREDALRCFSFDDGKEIWRRSYKVPIVNNHGISRTVPAVTDKYVVTVGPKCHAMCVDAETGDLKWGIDMVKDYGTKVPNWYTSQCPLIDGTTAILAPGGNEVLVMGVDCETGKVLWKAPNPKKWGMSHSSVVPMTVGAKKMFVYSSIGGLVAVSAGPEDAGTVLWESDAWGAEVLAPSPVPLKDGHLFLTAGYGKGSMLMKVTEAGGKYSAAKVWEKGPKDVLACEQQTPILWKDHLFSVHPKAAGPYSQQFVMMDPFKNEGDFIWGSGKTAKFELGPFILADDKFYILSDSGVLTMVKASIEGYEEIGKFHLIKGGVDAWAPIAVANGRMLLRDKLKFVCIDVDKRIE